MKIKLKNLPTKPGCYLFKNSAKKIIYIGKAKNIRKRVASYFKPELIDYKTRELISEATGLDFIITSNELEALLLEARLIKEHQPKYNIRLKTGVQYAYIRITDELFPRLETARTISKKDKVFGPFVSGQTRKELIWLANILFKLRTSKVKPRQVGKTYYIRISTHPWLRQVTAEEYAEDIKKAELLLRGNNRELIGQLQLEMRKFSDRKEYELALAKREQIKALQDLADKQKIYLSKSYDQDVINYIATDKFVVIQIFNIYKGVVSGRKEFKLPAAGYLDKPQVISDFIKQYYFVQEIPQEIIIPEKIQEQKLIEKYLSKRAGRIVKIFVPARGDKLKLLQLLKENILASLKTGDSSLFELQNVLNLPNLPRVIECFDVSNIGSKNMVGSMVNFSDGRLDKNNYRRFKIKTVRGQSDFDSMKEIIFRRYYRLKIENTPMPDLIMVDGGRPQLSAARLALRKLNIRIPIIALAKKEEEIFTLGRSEPIKLSRRSVALKLIQRIRNEAHRFAINYHRLLRSKNIGL